MIRGPVVFINYPFCSQQSCRRLLIPSQEKFRYENRQRSRFVCIFQQRFQLSSSHSPCASLPSAPNQLWQEPRKPDRARAAGQEPGPPGQRQLLGPFCQGLPLTWARVSSRSFPSLPEYPFRVSLSASVSVWLSLPSFLSDLVSPVQFGTNWFRLYERMRMDTMTWGSHTGLPLIQWMFLTEERSSQAFKPLRSFRLSSAYFGPVPLCGGTSLLLCSLKSKRIDTHLAAL